LNCYTQFMHSLRKQLSNLVTSARINGGLIGLIVGITFYVLIAFPSVAGFDGVDLSDLTNNRIPFDFKFNPSLDFYGGTELVYRISETDSSLQTVVNVFEKRLSSLDFPNYEVYGRQNLEGDQSLVVRIPKRLEQLSIFNELLRFNGSVTFQKQVPATETANLQADPQANPQAQPQFADISVSAADIEAYEITYYSGSYGFIVDFKNDKLTELLIQGYSDINPDSEARIILSIDNQPIAFQVSQISSNSSSVRTIFATTFLGDDLNSALLLKGILQGGAQGQNYTLETANNIPGRYDQFLPVFKYAGLGLLIVWAVAVLLRRRVFGLALILQLLFIGAFTISLAKFSIIPTTRLGGITLDIQQLPLTLNGIMAVLIVIALYLVEVRNMLPYFNFRSPARFLNIDRVKEIKHFSNLQAKLWLRLLFIFTTVLLIVNTLSINWIDMFAQYFVISALAIWLTYQIVIPTSLNLFKLKVTTNTNGKEKN